MGLDIKIPPSKITGWDLSFYTSLCGRNESSFTAGERNLVLSNQRGYTSLKFLHPSQLPW